MSLNLYHLTQKRIYNQEGIMWMLRIYGDFKNSISQNVDK